MIKVGLTGGIGSGKSTIAKIFHETYGIPVFEADKESKAIMDLPVSQEVIQKEFGTTDKKELANIVFSDAAKLQKLNMLLHPLVRKRFEEWVLEQKDVPYVIKEAAILIESGAAKDMDVIVTVEAEKSLRLQRVMERDQVSEEEVLRRMKWQLHARERIIRATYVIVNNGTSDVKAQVESTHKGIIRTLQEKYLKR